MIFTAIHEYRQRLVTAIYQPFDRTFALQSLSQLQQQVGVFYALPCDGASAPASVSSSCALLPCGPPRSRLSCCRMRVILFSAGVHSACYLPGRGLGLGRDTSGVSCGIKIQLRPHGVALSQRRLGRVASELKQQAA